MNKPMLARALRDLLCRLSNPDQADWNTIEDAWFEAALQAANEDYSAEMAETGRLLGLREPQDLKEGVERLLCRIDPAEEAHRPPTPG